jgi:hypothetical protein
MTLDQNVGVVRFQKENACHPMEVGEHETPHARMSALQNSVSD